MVVTMPMTMMLEAAMAVAMAATAATPKTTTNDSVADELYAVFDCNECMRAMLIRGGLL